MSYGRNDTFNIKVGAGVEFGDDKKPISFGMSINNIIKTIPKDTNVQLSFDKKNRASGESDLRVTVPSLGLCLHFNDISQELWAIEFFDFSLVTLRLRNQELQNRGAGYSYTYSSILNNFNNLGIALTPDYVNEDGFSTVFLMAKGIVFSFRADQVFPDSIAFERSKRESWKAQSLYLYSNRAHQITTSESLSRLDKFFSYEISFDERKIQATYSGPSSSIYFPNFPNKPRISIGTLAQEVTSSIGPPLSVHYRVQHDETSKKSDYYFNYFHFGLDILFDGFSHRVKLFLFQFNNPTVGLRFGSYNKANLELYIPFQEPLHPMTITDSDIWSDVSNVLDAWAPQAPRLIENGGINPVTTFSRTFPGLTIEASRSGSFVKISLFSPST